MLFLNPQLLEPCKGFFMLDFMPTPVSSCLGDREKLPAELRSAERSRQTGSAGSPARQSRRDWPRFLPGLTLDYCGIRQRQALLSPEREHATGCLAPVRDICVNQRLCK